MVMIVASSLHRLPASCKKKKAALELIANMSSYSSSVVSTIGLRSTLPTVLIAMSTPPKASTAWSKSVVTLTGSVRSPCTRIAFVPSSAIAACVFSASARELSLL